MKLLQNIVVLACLSSAVCSTPKVCSLCPPGTSSIGGIGTKSICTCLPGYMATDNGVACSACPKDTYKPYAGVGTCVGCHAHSSWDMGLLVCICHEDYIFNSTMAACIISDEVWNREDGADCGCT
jgi:hypothetical protein